MIYRDSKRCPHCESGSTVEQTKGPIRYRRCNNDTCYRRWRTLEIDQQQADDFMIWYLRQARTAAPVVQDMMMGVIKLQGELRSLIAALELEDDYDDDTEHHRERTGTERDLAAAGS